MIRRKGDKLLSGAFSSLNLSPSSAPTKLMKNKSKNPVGRPAFYKNAQELQKKICQYFKYGLRFKKVLVGPAQHKRIELIPVPTITGLVIYCGFSDRHSFYDLEKQEKFSHTIRHARTFIEREYEELLQTGNSAGAIFALKNFGWIDRQEVTRPPEENQTQEKISEQLSRITAILAKRKIG